MSVQNPSDKDGAGKDGAGNVQQGAQRPTLALKVRSLPDGEHPFEISRDARVLDLPAFTHKVDVTGSLKKESGRIQLHGTAVSKGHFECTRCTDPFDRVIKAPLELEFVPPMLENDPEDENTHVYDPLANPFIDITEDVRDALALAVPMKNLCRPDCKGLCPTCGKDLNDGPCECALEEQIGGGWSALKGLSERLRAEESKGPGAFSSE